MPWGGEAIPLLSKHLANFVNALLLHTKYGPWNGTSEASVSDGKKIFTHLVQLTIIRLCERREWPDAGNLANGPNKADYNFFMREMLAGDMLYNGPSKIHLCFFWFRGLMPWCNWDRLSYCPMFCMTRWRRRIRSEKYFKRVREVRCVFSPSSGLAGSVLLTYP